MKLVNKTPFSSEDLRVFFRAGLKHAGAELDKTITVELSRRGCVHGRAQLGRGELQGRWIRMWIPPDVDAFVSGGVTHNRLEWTRTKSLALVFEHEVAHSLGVEHADMDVTVRTCGGVSMPRDLPVPEWAAGLSIRVIPPKTTAKLTAQERAEMRESHAHKAKTGDVYVRFGQKKCAINVWLDQSYASRHENAEDVATIEDVIAQYAKMDKMRDWCMRKFSDLKGLAEMDLQFGRDKEE